MHFYDRFNRYGDLIPRTLLVTSEGRFEVSMENPELAL